MQIEIVDSVGQTLIFTIILVLISILSIRRFKDIDAFPVTLTNELKGLAILMVIFSHIGYFLFAGDQFLFPLSTMGGVGVNLFLFLSGYGLAVSQNSSSLTTINFYKKRLLKIFIPLWITLLISVIADKLILNTSYSFDDLARHASGFVSSNDIFTDINSPIWYIALILFYYLLFPLVYRKRYYVASSIFLAVISILFVNLPLPVNQFVLQAYKLHLIAFPLGILLAGIINDENIASFVIILKANLNRKNLYILSLILFLIISFLALNSNVDTTIWAEQLTSMLTVAMIIALFMIKRIRIQLLEILGKYSYEIYLLHWPIMSRYRDLYGVLPPAIAVILYILIILICSMVLNEIVMKRLVIKN